MSHSVAPHRCAGARPRDLVAADAARLIAPFVSGDAVAAQLPEITAEAFISRTARAADETSGLGILELFHGRRPPSRISVRVFLRPTLPACVHLARSAHHPGGYFRRHRWRRSCCLSRQSGYQCRRVVSEGPGFPHTGATAHVLGRQCQIVRGARTFDDCRTSSQCIRDQQIAADAVGRIVERPAHRERFDIAAPARELSLLCGGNQALRKQHADIDTPLCP